MSSAVLIVGMHRSGTSAVAGALSRLGIEFGDRLIPGDPRDNPLGYFEDRDVVAVHDRIALERGRTWDDPRPAVALEDPRLTRQLREALAPIVEARLGGEGIWGLKDPRLCRVLPAWLGLLDARGVATRVLLVLREPGQVGRSLEARNGFSEEKSGLLWLDHVLRSLAASQGHMRTWVRFDRFLSDPGAELERCARELDIQWPTPPSPETLETIVRPSQSRHGGVSAAPTGPAGRLAAEIWSHLETDGLPTGDRLAEWGRGLHEIGGDATSLALEHATQLADRMSRDRAWGVAQSTRNELAASAGALSTRIDDLEAAIRDLATDLGDRRQAVERCEAELDSVRRQCARVAAELEGHATGRDETAREVAEHARELQNLGRSVTRVAAERLEADQALESSLQTLHGQVGALVGGEGRLGRLENRVARLEGPAAIRRWIRTRFGRRSTD